MTSPSPFPAPTSPLYAIACNWVRAVNAKDFAALEQLYAAEYTSQNHPRSLRTPGHEERVGKQASLERGKQMLGVIVESFGADIDHPVNVVEGKDVIVLQLTSTGTLKSGAPFSTDHLYIFRFNADHKIVAMDTWTDSAYMQQAFAATAFPKIGGDGTMSNLVAVAARK